MSTTTSLSLHDGDPILDPTPYRSIIGSLQYCIITHLDICFALSKVFQFMHKPTIAHWQLVKRILCYLKSSMSHYICLYSSLDLSLTCYMDADWTSNPDDRKSTSGYCYFLGPNLISWSSNKHKVVSRSNTESEYRGLSNATAELMCIETLLSELHIPLFATLVMFHDNVRVHHMARHPMFHARTKQVEIVYHFVRDRAVNNQLLL